MQYFVELKNHESTMDMQDPNKWLIRYVGTLALCASIEGPKSHTLYQAYEPHIEWIFENAQFNSIILNRSVARFFSLIAKHCPQLIMEGKESQAYHVFLNWYEMVMTVKPPRQPEIVLSASQAMSNLFISLE